MDLPDLSRIASISTQDGTQAPDFYGPKRGFSVGSGFLPPNPAPARPVESGTFPASGSPGCARRIPAPPPYLRPRIAHRRTEPRHRQALGVSILNTSRLPALYLPARHEVGSHPAVQPAPWHRQPQICEVVCDPVGSGLRFSNPGSRSRPAEGRIQRRVPSPGRTWGLDTPLPAPHHPEVGAPQSQWQRLGGERCCESDEQRARAPAGNQQSGGIAPDF